MMIIPKRGYRVCLHCGKILLSRQVIEGKIRGKKVKVCPNCNEPERVSKNENILNEVNAVDLFRIAEMKSKEFNLNSELEAKYDRMYDNCLIPKEIRV